MAYSSTALIISNSLSNANTDIKYERIVYINVCSFAAHTTLAKTKKLGGDKKCSATLKSPWRYYKSNLCLTLRA